MRMYPAVFPELRKRLPERRAERRMYEALASADRRGFVYYEWRRGYQRPEVDFAIWVEDLGRFALQVKGGHYRLVDGEWCLRTRRGWQTVENSPLDAAWLGALDLHDDIAELAETAYNPFVIPVLAFPDMEPDEAIAALARRRGVYLLWRRGSPIQGLEEVVWRRGGSGALPMERIGREVHATTDGLIRLNGCGDAAGAGQAEGSVASTHPMGQYTLSLSAGGLNIIRVGGCAARRRLQTVIDHRGR